MLNGEIIKKEYNDKTQNWSYKIQGYDPENDEGTAVVAIKEIEIRIYWK